MLDTGSHCGQALWLGEASEILVNIGSGNGLVTKCRQAITWISADWLRIGWLRRNYKIWSILVPVTGELKWSGGGSTGTLGSLSARERSQYQEECPAMNTTEVHGSTSIPTRLDTLIYRKPFPWLTTVGTTRITIIRLALGHTGLAVLIIHAAGVGLTGRSAVISSRYNKCHSLQLQNYMHTH